jgi:hypothetical protein
MYCLYERNFERTETLASRRELHGQAGATKTRKQRRRAGREVVVELKHIFSSH